MSKQSKPVIILESYKFDWTPDEIAEATRLFNEGLKPSAVAMIMNEKVINIGLLFIHLADKGKIKQGGRK